MDWYILSHSRSDQFGKKKKIVLERMLIPQWGYLASESLSQINTSIGKNKNEILERIYVLLNSIFWD